MQSVSWLPVPVPCPLFVRDWSTKRNKEVILEVALGLPSSAHLETAQPAPAEPVTCKQPVCLFAQGSTKSLLSASFCIQPLPSSALCSKKLLELLMATTCLSVAFSCPGPPLCSFSCTLLSPLGVFPVYLKCLCISSNEYIGRIFHSVHA